MSARYGTQLFVDMKIEELKFEEKKHEIYIRRSMQN